MSILRSNPQAKVVAHILARPHRGLTASDKQVLQQLAAQYNGEAHFYEPDESLLEGFRIHASSSHISLVTYYRCMLADYLPASLHRVIYLDSDLLVTGSLAPFWQMSMQGAPVAAVVDAAADDHTRYKVLCYPEADSYFNAGVLLIDLDWWRANNVGQRCIDYYRAHPERIRFNDQDLLNSLFHGQVCWAPLRYNAQEGFYRQRYAHYNQHKAELQHPVVVHYTNRKPWDWDSLHPMRQLFSTISSTPRGVATTYCTTRCGSWPDGSNCSPTHCTCARHATAGAFRSRSPQPMLNPHIPIQYVRLSHSWQRPLWRGVCARGRQSRQKLPRH